MSCIDTEYGCAFLSQHLRRSQECAVTAERDGNIGIDRVCFCRFYPRQRYLLIDVLAERLLENDTCSIAAQYIDDILQALVVLMVIRGTEDCYSHKKVCVFLLSTKVLFFCKNIRQNR